MNEFLQRLADKTYEDLVSFGKIAIKKLLPHVKELDEKNGGALFIVSMLLSAVSADKQFTMKEMHYICDVLTLSPERLEELLNLYTPTMAELVDTFADHISAEVKADTCMLVGSVLVCDGEVNHQENDFIKKIIE